MTQSESHAVKDQPEHLPTQAPHTTLEDLGSRAADRSADLYAELEHERRDSRYTRALNNAREEQ
jgi:hypothetical protein